MRFDIDGYTRMLARVRSTMSTLEVDALKLANYVESKETSGVELRKTMF